MSILDRVGRTPLVELRNIAAGLKMPVLAKCEHLNPGGSVKDRIAVAIIQDAEQRGLLQRGATLIEATAGNTGTGLALVAAIRGYKLVCVMPEKMSHDKRAALIALGAQVIITPNRAPDHPENFQNVAARLAHENGWFLTDQFRNPANVLAHETTTGPEILEQTRGRIQENDKESPLDHIAPLFGQVAVAFEKARWKAELNGQFNGKKDSSDYKLLAEDNELYSADPVRGYTPSWMTANLRMGYQFNERFAAQLSCENILDRYYRVFASGVSAPGRNWIFTLRYKW